MTAVLPPATATRDAARSTPPPKSARLPELDALRGLFLLWMTLTHLPTRLSAISNQAIGYVSSAEGFIFLAAFLTARVARRQHEKYGPRVARQWLFGRLRRIYRYHLALLALAFTGAAGAAVYLHRVPLQNLLDFYLRHPKSALAAAPVLLYNPPLFDILPLYIVFMLLTPLLLAAAKRFGSLPVVLASGMLWLAAQFHLRESVFAAAAQWGFPIPLNQTGAFDLFAWQFLWTAGLLLGAGSGLSRPRISRYFVWASAAVALALLAARHAHLELLTGPQLFGILVDKWKLGILRWFNAGAIGILLIRFGGRLAHEKLVGALAPLGKASLEVFSAHVLFCLIALGLSADADPRFAWWQDLLIAGAAVAGLFAVARWAARRAAVPGTIRVRCSEIV